MKTHSLYDDDDDDDDEYVTLYSDMLIPLSLSFDSPLGMCVSRSLFFI